MIKIITDDNQFDMLTNKNLIQFHHEKRSKYPETLIIYHKYHKKLVQKLYYLLLSLWKKVFELNGPILD